MRYSSPPTVTSRSCDDDRPDAMARSCGVDRQRRLPRQRVGDLARAVDGLLHGVELEGGTVAIVGVVSWRTAEVTAEGHRVAG